MSKHILTLAILLILSSSSSAALEIESDTIDPPSYELNETINHLYNNVDISGLSTDGETDTVYFTFPDSVRLDPNNVTSDLSTVSGPELVDRDLDGLKESIAVGINEKNKEKTRGQLTIDTAAWFKDAHTDVHIQISIHDSAHGISSDNNTIFFEGNEMAFNHREDNHTHQNDFSQSTSTRVCTTLPPVMRPLVDLLSSGL